MTSLVKNILGSCLIGLSLFGACKQQEALPILSTDQVSLGVNKSARVSADITVRVDAVSDSRCPTSVVCFWGGEASVSLSLSKGTRTEKRRLTIPSPTKDRIDSTTVQFGDRQYKVILQAVTPYPKEPGESVTKQVTVRVAGL